MKSFLYYISLYRDYTKLFFSLSKVLLLVDLSYLKSQYYILIFSPDRKRPYPTLVSKHSH